MPRGTKKETKAARKPYPTREERLKAVETQIARLTKLNEKRQLLVSQTEALLAERKDTLEKSTQALAKAEAKKAKIVAMLDRPAKKDAQSAEERTARRREALAKARQARTAKSNARKAEKAKLDQLMDALVKQGKSVDELLKELGQ